MISVTAAKEIVRNHVALLEPRRMLLSEAVGLVLAEDIVAPADFPAFRQAAMDGYAFRFADWQPQQSLPVGAVVVAGSEKAFRLPPQEAVRIFTGAPVPDGADTVVMQEKTRREGQVVFIDDSDLGVGVNVRPVGSEIRKGALALEKGTFLTPGAIGFLAGLGLTEVNVYPSPSVALLVTGKELQTPGKPLGYGQVYESNSFSLRAALQQLGVREVVVQYVDDTIEATVAALANALATHDLLLLTGGISVGDYDFVLPAAEQCGVTKLFHKVAQKPGKPLYFGAAGKKVVFGLPGNPSSVLTCFYQYVVPALENMMLRYNLLPVQLMPLQAEVQKKKGLTHFLKGAYNGDGVQALTAQESFRLRSFAVANCLIELNAEAEVFAAGTMVPVHILSV